MANVELVWIGDLPIDIKEASFQERLGQYDSNDDGALDDQNTITILQNVMEKAGYNPPTIDMLKDLRDTYIEVNQAYQMVTNLKKLPHEVNAFRMPCFVSCDFGWVEYEYTADVWKNKILPLIGENTQSYQARLQRAAAQYRDFAKEYLNFTNPELIDVGSENGTLANYPLWTKVNVGNVPPPLQATVIGVTMMMSEIMDWHWPEPGGPIAQIECEGNQCPADDESEKFYLTPKDDNRANEKFYLSVIGADLCYVLNEWSDAFCYGGSFNPHIKLDFALVFGLGLTRLYAKDERSGHWQIGIYNALDVYDRITIQD